MDLSNHHFIIKNPCPTALGRQACAPIGREVTKNVPSRFGAGTTGRFLTVLTKIIDPLQKAGYI
jgi:hypothetical protein